jgi:ankyrin repeat protein
VKALLELGANVMAKNATKNTSLILACGFGHTAVVEQLLLHDSSSAFLNSQNTNGDTGVCCLVEIEGFTS